MWVLAGAIKCKNRERLYLCGVKIEYEKERSECVYLRNRKSGCFCALELNSVL